MVRPPRIHRIAVIAILATALGVRLVACLWWEQRLGPDTKFTFGDSASYWILAERIGRGEPYAYGPGQSRAFRMPGYPSLLAPLFVLYRDPPVLAARVLGAILGTWVVGGVIWLARQRFDPWSALVAGLLTLAYPGAIGMSVFVLSEAAFCPLMLAQLVCWTAAIQREHSLRRSALWSAAAGVAAGLATLIRPSWLFFTPVAALVDLTATSNRQRHLMVAVTTLTLFLAVMAPWWIRNYRIYDRFVPTTLQVGASLYDGLNPNATGASDMRFVNQFYAAQRQQDVASASPPKGAFDERLDRRMRDAAIDWARGHPRRVLELMAIKLGRMWSPWPAAAEMRGALALLILCGYLPLVSLAVWGLLRLAPRDLSTLLCVLPAIYFSGLHMVFVSSIRYRQPVMLPLIVFAAAAFVQVVRRRQGSRDAEITASASF